MEFHSCLFFGFLITVLAVHYLLPQRYRAVTLLVASYVFYGAWDARFCFLIAGSTIIDYGLGLRIAAATGRARKAYLALSVAANLGILGVFKYCDFFIRSFAELVDADPENYLLHLVLPVGISFFTFQTMSYTADVYRGVIKPRTSILDFGLYVAFFPQLVAGPIVKAREFFPQHDRWAPPSAVQWREGITLILLGLVKKMACADQLARYADPYFADPSGGLLDAWTAVIAFGGQIYFDFSGYSDIAIGVALLLGYRFPVNFARPYLSCSVTEFWRRWHISLSTWLRDYLYISLGGNRGGSFRTQRNLMITMLLGGLWHGASWNFLVWGGLHGLYLVIQKLWVTCAGSWIQFANSTAVMKSAYKGFAWLLTLTAIGLAWVFFRAREFEVSWQIVESMFSAQMMGSSVFPAVIGIVILGWFAIALLEERVGAFRHLIEGSSTRLGLVWAAMLFLLLVFARTDSHVTFLYFQF